jgi:hypothetical protein
VNGSKEMWWESSPQRDGMNADWNKTVFVRVGGDIGKSCNLDNAHAYMCGSDIRNYGVAYSGNLVLIEKDFLKIGMIKYGVE